MLRKIRITLATICFVLVNVIFLGAGWAVTQHIAWVAKIQFLPALMALNYSVLLVLIACTLLFGRLYCSVICPLGVMQDIFGWMGKKAKKNRYSHSPEKKWLRYGVLAVFILCLIIGFAPVTTLLAPYSAYGRIVNSLFRPLYDLLLNGMAAIESNFDSYLFAPVELWMRSVTTFVVALLTLGLLGFLAWRNGRTYCNTVCPVGTILSFFSRFSLMRVQLDKSKCKNCGLCERNCKTSAIDFKAGTVDPSRCITCGDCLDKCKHDALKYKPVIQITNDKSQMTNTKPDASRRAFVTGAVMATGAALMAETKIKVDGGMAAIVEKKAPRRETPLTPPGSISGYNLKRHCTACQLCVSACPNNALRPSTDPMRLMQPEMSFERGYCRPECTHCSEVCPTGAIKAITKEQKTAIRIGHAEWIEQNCLLTTTDESCGLCARHCPVQAIDVTERTLSVNNGKCIGCGKCEYLCPARPFSAIYVEGNKTHHYES